MLPAGCGGLFEAIRALTGSSLDGKCPSVIDDIMHWKPRICIAMRVGILAFAAESRWSLHAHAFSPVVMIDA